ncbi:E3 ubiquitin-protein ligase listerin [Babesia sp. Xinjiang]|uniref:E3 ubiquitin-protein ligase listerin n=1 Tax=Babesia sp. Xinjiang TaxID=462227 RepID=UPI000A22883E|nr:E3 ubiquitin-protein ligase listerin [Babesia sp. Xinjiang]ORM42043.1 E3 ubiquitin-protein ligase listerin [Babesia sp. Xinjiang]
MTRAGKKREDRKVRSSDFAMYQLAESRPTGLHHIFDAFRQDSPTKNTADTLSSPSSDGTSSAFSVSRLEILKALDKLTKKDSTTKLKALEQLMSAVESVPHEVLERLIPDFAHVFLRLAVVEPSRKIRFTLGQVLRNIATSLKRRIQSHINILVTHWWIAMHDEAADVAELYTDAFNCLFESQVTTRAELDRKTFRVLTHYIRNIANTTMTMINRHIDDYKREWMDVFGKICENCATISDMHNRLICSVLRSLMTIMTYQRLYGSEGGQDGFPVSVFINEEFVHRIGSLCRSTAIKQRFASTRLLVEFVKVLRDEDFDVGREAFSVAMYLLHEAEEATITFHRIRLLCACSRYNSAFWEPQHLKKYVPFVKGILDRYTGDFSAMTELYSVFPCMVSYLPKEWLHSPTGVQAVIEVTTNLLQLMQDKVNANYEQSFGFDSKAFSQMGSSMLYCYYRILLLPESSFESLVDHIFAPILHLTCEDSSYAKHFLLHLPRIFTEFIEESAILQDAGTSDVLLEKLTQMYDKKTNCVFMTHIFGFLAKMNGVESENGQLAKVRSYAQRAGQDLKMHIMHQELPRVLQEFMMQPCLSSCATPVEDILTVLSDVESVPQQSSILEAPTFLMSNVYDDEREFRTAFDIVTRILQLLKPVLEDPEKYYTDESDANTILLVSLVALRNCDSEKDAVTIGRRVFTRHMDLDHGNGMTVFLKFIHECQRFSGPLSALILSWLSHPEHIRAETCENVYLLIDGTLLDEVDAPLYDIFYMAYHLVKKYQCKRRPLKCDDMVDDMVALYLVGYYCNLPIELDTFLKFCLTLLPIWKQGSTAADDLHIISFLHYLQSEREPHEDLTNGWEHVYPIKELVNVILEMQDNPFRSTRSISRTLSALTTVLDVDGSVLYHRNALLFSNVWLINCEKWLLPQVVMDKCHDGSVESSLEPNPSTDDATASIKCFAEVFVSTFLNNGFSVASFESLADELGKDLRCTGVITESFARHVCSTSWASKFEYDKNLRLFTLYLSKLKCYDTVMAFFKQHYTSNQFMGGFVAAINRVLNVPVTLVDDICQIMESCGENDTALLTNCMLELGQLLASVVTITNCGYKLKDIEDRPYLTLQMESLPQRLFQRFAAIRCTDSVSKCWLHYAFMGFLRSRVCIVQAISGDLGTFLNRFVGGWMMNVLSFCYQELEVPHHLVITLFADALHFFLSNNAVSFDDLRLYPSSYEFSTSSLREYVGVLEALSKDVMARIATENSQTTPLEPVDVHYLVVMLVHVVESVDAYVTTNGPDSEHVRDAAKSLQSACYEFLRFISKSQSCYMYVVSFVSRLWHVRFLFSNISDYGGVLCKMDLENNGVYLSIPIDSVSFALANGLGKFGAAGNVPVDMSQLLYHLLQDPDTGELDKETTSELEELPSAQTHEIYAKNGSSAISFCLNVILGPHITSALFSTYDVLLSSSDHRDLELCLTAWLSAIVLLQDAAESKMFTLKNALAMLLKVRPTDAGGDLFDTLLTHLSTAAYTDKEYVNAWWMTDAPQLPEHTDEPALYVLLQVLLLCLENLPLHDEHHQNLIKRLYYKVAKMFPEEVNHVWNVCKSPYVKKQIREFTKNEITQRLIADELLLIKKDMSSALRVTHDADYRNVYVALETKAEVAVNLTVKIPSAFPLEPLSFASNDVSGTFKNKHLRWLMMAQSAANRCGIVQGLLLWSDNITKFFDGIEECPICYSIVHLQFNSIPSKTCKVCKHKFHTECLYK